MTFFQDNLGKPVWEKQNHYDTRSPAVGRDGRPYCPSRKTNPNPNPNVAGHARVRRRLGTCHGGQMGKNRHFSFNHFTAMEN